MVIIKVMGGLGNQLQQYALYRKLESMGKEVRLDVTWFQDEKVQASVAAGRSLEMDRLEGIQYRAATPEEIRNVLGRLWEEKESAVSKVKRKLHLSADPCFQESDQYHEQIFAMTDKYLVGYWACEKYYADILPILREEIHFPVRKDAEADRRDKDVIGRMDQTESVSVHVRRGDYLEDNNRVLFGGICTETYYKTAIAEIRKKFPEVRVFFFSDDVNYVREHYREEADEIVDWNQGEDSFYDMMLMSHCKHNICANSTFSFWGARLNPYPSKIMIRPSIHKNTQVCNPEKMKDWWKGWTLITPQGKILV